MYNKKTKADVQKKMKLCRGISKVLETMSVLFANVCREKCS